MDKLFTTSFSKSLYLAARLLIAAAFLTAGIHKIVAWDGPAMWIASKGLPMPNVLLGIATVAEIGGAICLIFNIKVKWVSLLLAAFLLGLTVMMHNFWTMEGMMYQTSFLDFIQNITSVGGILALAALAHKMEK